MLDCLNLIFTTAFLKGCVNLCHRLVLFDLFVSKLNFWYFSFLTIGETIQVQVIKINKDKIIDDVLRAEANADCNSAGHKGESSERNFEQV